MAISPDTLVAERYKLTECLGSGGMGEVWKARDTKFLRPVEVAIKFLKEDETFAADARNRSNLARAFQKDAESGYLTPDLIANLLVESLGADAHRDVLRAAVEVRLSGGAVTPAAALALFDEFVNVGTFNENARNRRRLRELFAAEANAVAMLQHPNLVRVTDHGEHESVPFLVMDFINGRTLQQVIQRREPLPLVRRLRLMEDLCEGLGYAHAKDLVHRDIKPANLIIDSESGRLKVLDFGVVRQLDSGQHTMTLGLPVGTYCYMSPEQSRASQSLDQRSDIFAVGLVLYELLSFQRAFPSAGDVGELIGRIQRKPPVPLRDRVPDLDPEIETVVYKAIEKVPAKRYQTLAEMQRQIEPVRRRLEDLERHREQLSTQVFAELRPVARQIADSLERARVALELSDDRDVLEQCELVLLLAPGHQEALDLKRLVDSRVQSQAVASLLVDARAELERGELTAAGLVLERAEADPRIPQVRAFIDDLDAARRAQRVGTLLQDARMYLATGAVDAALERAQAILDLDATHSEGLRLFERARNQQKLLRQQQVDAALASADAALVEGRLNEAIRLVSPFAGEPDADALLATLLPRRDEQAARDEKIRDLLARARSLTDAGAFADAHELAVQASVLDRKHHAVVELRRQLEPVTRAVADLDEVIDLFDQDAADEAERRVEATVAALTPQVAAFPALARRLDELATARRSAAERQTAERQREAAAADERRRRALQAEQEDRDRAVADAVQRVRAALALDRIDAAERELAALTQLPGSDALVPDLGRELAACRRRAADAAAARQCEVAKTLVETGDLERALALLRAYTPVHALVEAEIQAIETQLRRREEERVRAAESERVRRDIERRADEAIVEAEARFMAGERAEALAKLRAFRPRHARIDQRHADLVKEHARHEAAERAAMEQARLAAEHERAVAEERELLARAETAGRQREYAAALALVGELLTRDAAHGDARRLRAELLGEVHAASARDPSNPEWRRLLRQHGKREPSARVRMVWMAGAAALVVIVVLAVVVPRRPASDPGTPVVPTPREQPPAAASDAVAPGPEQVSPEASPTLPAPRGIAAAAKPAVLTVDFRPWARVRIAAKAEGVAGLDSAFVTPFTITLPPGEYVLRGENGNLTGPVLATVRLEAGQTRLVSQSMPGFNADRVIESLLPRDR